MTTTLPQINEKRLLGRLEALARITDPAQPYTRRAFTDLYLKGREWLKQEMAAAGLSVHLDEAGNLIGRREGTNPNAKTLMLGSHTDTVVGGGRFDGILGVLAALEVAQSLQDSGTQLHHPLEVVDFLSEEPSDYGASCVGSRGMAGTLTPALLAQTNAAGETLEQAMRRMGAQPEKLTGPLRDDLAAFLEIHIEQGPVLEHVQKAIGIVSGIVAIERYELILTGRPDHAGTTPMHLRWDALVAAAGCITALHTLANDEAQRIPLVATVGQLRVFPNNSNVVPGQVILGFEARTLDADDLERFTANALGWCEEIAGRHEIELEHRLVSHAAPLVCDSRIQGALAEACADLALPYQTMHSGAGHDAMQVGRLTPAGMLFVPSVRGRSHCPDELTHDQDLLNGARVLLHTTLKLDALFGGHA